MLKKITKENEEIEYIESENFSEDSEFKKKYLSFFNKSEKNIKDFISGCKEIKKNKDNMIFASIKHVINSKRNEFTMMYIVMALLSFVLLLIVRSTIKEIHNNSVSNMLYHNNIDIYFIENSIKYGIVFTFIFAMWILLHYFLSRNMLYNETNEEYSKKIKRTIDLLEYNELYFFIKEKELSETEAISFIKFMRNEKKNKLNKFFNKFNVFRVTGNSDVKHIRSKLDKKYLKFLSLTNLNLNTNKGESNE